MSLYKMGNDFASHYSVLWKYPAVLKSNTFIYNQKK